MGFEDRQSDKMTPPDDPRLDDLLARYGGTKSPSETRSREHKPGLCPKCLGDVNPSALVCRHCRFEIAKYVENLRLAKMTAMAKSTQDYRAASMRSLYKAGGCMWMPLVIAGVLVLFIPVVGWIASPVFFLSALIFFVAPVRGAMLLEWISDRRKYRANLLMATRMSENTYTEVSCPHCGNFFATGRRKTICRWPDNGNHPIQCVGCGKTVYRVGDSLLWVPHSDVSLSGDLGEYL